MPTPRFHTDNSSKQEDDIIVNIIAGDDSRQLRSHLSH